MQGRLEVICGPMFSGKSEELMRRLRRADIAGYNVTLVKPAIDGRYGDRHVKSHSGMAMLATSVNTAGGIPVHAFSYGVVGIDEGQFFDDDDFVEIVQESAKKRIVIISGLDMNFRCEPFGHMPTLLAVADRVDKLTAICHKCGGDATLTQRLVDGKPAPFQGPTVLVGGFESYEARCRNCFEAA
jgi:thymidine kinase